MQLTMRFEIVLSTAASTTQNVRLTAIMRYWIGEFEEQATQERSRQPSFREFHDDDEMLELLSVSETTKSVKTENSLGRSHPERDLYTASCASDD